MNIRKIMTVVVILFSITGFSIATVNDVDDAAKEPILAEGNEDTIETCGITYVDGNPVLEAFPVKTEEQLAKIIKDPQPTRSFDDLPSQFSWLDYAGGNWMTPAKDQANCGSCWAFGALGCVESSINIASGYPDKDFDLSEQYVLSCLGSAGSCSGGWMSEAFDCIQSTNTGSSGNGINGVPLESCMPYQAVDYIPCDDKCDDWDFVELSNDGKLWEIESWGVTAISEDSESDWNMLKTWVMDYGPISVDIVASGGWNSFWSNNNNPNAVYQNDDPGITNHAQILCGWVDDSSIVNGGYWILKNSWGSDWGYNGYSNVAYGCISLGTRDVSWCTTPEWPNQPSDGPGPGTPDMHVFADFSYGPEYAHLGENIEFFDESQGPVALREWDFNSDGVIDSTAKRPTQIFNQEGDYKVNLTVWSTYGLSSTISRTVSVREVWEPTAVITPGYISDNEVEVTLEGRYSYDGDGQVVGYDIDRLYEVTLTVTDNDGATGTVMCPVYIDVNVAPETIAMLGVGQSEDSWYKTSQKVQLIAEDWTGVSSTFYRVDDGDWKEYGNPFWVLGEGEHDIEFYSVDVFGNEESVQSAMVKIDKTAPSLDVSVSGGSQVDGWYTSPVTVSLSGSDSLSGLNTIIYRVESGSWQEYSGSFSLGDGSYRVWAYAVDVAGNTFGSDDPVVIQVDSGAPVTKASFVGDGSDGVFYERVTVRLVASDAGSGVDELLYRVNGGEYVVYDGSFVLDSVGSYSIDFYAVDNLGNEESVQSVSVVVSDVNFVAELMSPVSGLYVLGLHLFNFEPAVVIGPVDMVVDVESFTSGAADVSLVEFLVDGVVVGSVSSAPFSYRLEDSLSGSHEVSARVLSGSGGSVEVGSTVTFFIF